MLNKPCSIWHLIYSQSLTNTKQVRFCIDLITEFRSRFTKSGTVIALLFTRLKQICFAFARVQFWRRSLRYLSPDHKSMFLGEGSINDHFWFSKYKRTSIVVVSQTRAHYNKYKSIKTLSKISSVFHLLFLNHKSRMWCKYYHLFISVAANFWVLRYDFILNMLAGNESIKSQITWAADVHGHIWEIRVVNRRSYLSFIVTGLKFVAPCIVFC